MMVKNRIIEGFVQEFVKSRSNSQNSLSVEVNNEKVEFVKNNNPKKQLDDVFSIFEIEKPEFGELEIKEDTKIKIEGIGELNIIITNSLNLNLEYGENTLCKLNVIIRDENKVNIFSNENSDNFLRELNFYIGNNSDVKFSFLNFKTKYLINNFEIKDNSKVDIKGLNFIKFNNCFNLNQMHHISSGGVSNIKIENLADNESVIECDMKTIVDKNLNSIEAHQKSNGLLLSKKSKISCEPILEIKSKDVICNHGAMISKILDEDLFYMQTRGMNKEQIINLMVEEKIESIKSSIL